MEILGIVVVRPGSGTYLRDGVSELLPRTLSWGLMLGAPRTRELVELRSGLEVQAAQLTDEGHAAAALKEHATLYEALAARDAEAVTATMRSHMQTASRRLLAGFDASQ